MNSISDRELLENLGPGGTAPVYRVSSGGADCTESNRIGAGGSDAAWKMIRELAEERCFQALREIRNVLDDSGLTDPECFAEIEKIISVLEELGSGLSGRQAARLLSAALDGGGVPWYHFPVPGKKL